VFHIDSARCTGCGTCVELCPQAAISLIGDKAVIGQGVCIECGICLEACPVGAIYELTGVPQVFGMRKRLAYNRGEKEVSRMRGRGWFGWGGPGGGGSGRGWFGGPGWGRGNPYPFCRFHPWLPRRWWAYGAGFYPLGPYPGTTGMPYYPPAAGAPYYPTPTGYPWW